VSTKVEEIAAQVKALPNDEWEEFLSWLADFQIERSDEWDQEIARDSRPGGCRAIGSGSALTTNVNDSHRRG
jgi:hypothetical protein